MVIQKVHATPYAWCGRRVCAEGRYGNAVATAKATAETLVVGVVGVVGMVGMVARLNDIVDSKLLRFHCVSRWDGDYPSHVPSSSMSLTHTAHYWSSTDVCG